MIGNNALLDTNIIIEIFGNNIAVADTINTLSIVYVNPIILGELYVGINRVTNKQMHLQKLVDFRKFCKLLPVDEATAAIYGEISAALYKKGKPIPTNDIWIAASSKQYDLPLFTKDKHFLEVNGLNLQLF